VGHGHDLDVDRPRKGNAAIFFAIDHCSLEVVGIHAAKRGTRFEALEPIRQGVRHSFGAFGKDVAKGLTLRHDHGSQFIADDFQNEIKLLGHKGFGVVREGAARQRHRRALVRILKENLLWVRSFDTVEGLRLRSWPSRTPTTGSGASAGMAIVRRRRSGSSRRLRSPRPPNFRGQTSKNPRPLRCQAATCSDQYAAFSERTSVADAAMVVLLWDKP